MNGTSPAPRLQPDAPPDDRLDSWKEIAAYLRRDESTVRRWEKDGLPVHRHRHKFRAAVFAYKSELDSWWNNGSRQASTSMDDGSVSTKNGAVGNNKGKLASSSMTTTTATEALTTPLHGSSVQTHAMAGRWRFPSIRLAVLAGVLAVVTAGSYFGWNRWISAHQTVTLAVLPLQNLSGDPNEEYFSDGLTEEMITQLSRLQANRLNVIARTSSMQYKGTAKRANVIGSELRANYLLEGSVRRDAEQVRITVQLIRASDQTHVWAENYQRQARDILTLQSEVAAAVARAISLKLTPQERADLASAGPVNPEAYQLYLRGRYLWNQRTEEGLQKAIAYFQQAIAKDPSSAASYAALADAYNVAGNWGMLAPKDAYPQAKDAAIKALDINERHAEAHVALGYATFLYDWNPTEAEKEFKRGLELNPNYAPGHQWYAVFLASRGRFDEAIAHVTRARELDPLSLIIGDVVGWIYSLARQHNTAIEEFRKALELDPKFYPTHYDLGMTYADAGMHQEAIAELETAYSLSGDTPRTLSGLAYAYALAGQTSKANRLLDKLRELSSHRYVPPFDLAVIYAALGQKDIAFSWLEKAYEDRHPWLVMLQVSPKMDGLRSDARFENLLHRVGFTP